MERGHGEGGREREEKKMEIPVINARGRGSTNFTVIPESLSGRYQFKFFEGTATRVLPLPSPRQRRGCTAGTLREESTRNTPSTRGHEYAR